jgi:hypothetical protein
VPVGTAIVLPPSGIERLEISYAFLPQTLREITTINEKKRDLFIMVLGFLLNKYNPDFSECQYFHETYFQTCKDFYTNINFQPGQN